MHDEHESIAGHVDSVVALLRWRAQRTPARRACTCLLDGEDEKAFMSYAELDLRARGVAARLRAAARPGDRALLLFPPGLDYITGFMGCLYAGVVAVPIYPPRPNRPDPRLDAVAADSGATIALTTGALRPLLERRAADSPALQGLRFLACEGVFAESEAEWKDPGVGRGSLAFLQYTSGSTTAPRGVRVTHGNLLENLEAIRRGLGLRSDDHWVTWLPPYHDMGLIGGILSPLYMGNQVTLMAPAAFLQRPLRWLQALSNARGTVSGAPNFAYELCLSKIRPEHLQNMNLSAWRVAFNGAEPVRPHTLARFTAAFASCGFRASAHRPCYGLAEATLMVSAAPAPHTLRVDAAALQQHQVVVAHDGAGYELASCGPVAECHAVVIADPDACRPVAPGLTGEIWFAGPSVAAGYWGRPEPSRATFEARLEGHDGVAYLRTGDLGFLHEGDLYVTGRLKDLIILDGRNHYPQDIELTAEGSHAALRPGCSAAFSVEMDRKERLIVVVEVDRAVGTTDEKGAASATLERPDRIQSAVRAAINGAHDVDVHEVVLLHPGGVPKTTSGKVQRQNCRTRYLEGSLNRWGT